MLPPAVLPLFAWIALLKRYPKQTLTIVLPVLGALFCVALWVHWQEKQHEALLREVEIQVEYDPKLCSIASPLHIQISNSTQQTLTELQWHIGAQLPREDVNIARGSTQRLDAPLSPGTSWDNCVPLPQLRSGYRPETLQFNAQNLKGRFASE